MPYQTRVDVQRNVERPLWRAMLEADHPMSVPELHLAICANPASIRLRLKDWKRAGLVQQLEGRPLRYTITLAAEAANDDRYEPPQVDRSGGFTLRHRSQRARLWSAMRVLKRFTVPELTIAAGATKSGAHGMVSALCRAGYMRREQRSLRRGELAVYLLVNRSGPKAPQLRYRSEGGRRQRYFFDPNTGASIDLAPSGGDDRGEG